MELAFTVEVLADFVASALRSKDWLLVDAREPDAYIGFDSPGRARGGHLPRAAICSSSWFTPFWRRYEPQLERKVTIHLALQHITPEKQIIVYDENGTDAFLVLKELRARGFEQLYYFCLSGWTGELECYPMRHLLAPVRWVKELLEGQHRTECGADGFKIFETAWKAPSPRYLEMHIPGAVHIDTNEFEKPPEWVRKSDAQLLQFAAENGITPDTTVIVYGNDYEMGAPAKLSAVLRYMGVRDVRCLNGTLLNWLAAGYPVESGNVEKSPCTIHSEAFRFDPRQIVDLTGAKQMLAHHSLGTLIDTRRWECFIGADSGYDYVLKAGRIPGSIWCWQPSHYANPDHTMGNALAMRQVWELAGIDRRKPMAFFCGSASWGAAIIKLYANVAGYENATIFEGGWCQWQLDPDNPYETGIPEELKDYQPDQNMVGIYGNGGCHVDYEGIELM